MIEVASPRCVGETGGSSQDMMLYGSWPQYVWGVLSHIKLLWHCGPAEEKATESRPGNCKCLPHFRTLQVRKRDIRHRTGESFEHLDIEKARARRVIWTPGHWESQSGETINSTSRGVGTASTELTFVTGAFLLRQAEAGYCSLEKSGATSKGGGQWDSLGSPPIGM